MRALPLSLTQYLHSLPVNVRYAYAEPLRYLFSYRVVLLHLGLAAAASHPNQSEKRRKQNRLSLMHFCNRQHYSPCTSARSHHSA